MPDLAMVSDLALIDLRASLRSFVKMGDQAPFQRVEMALATTRQPDDRRI